MNGHIRTETRSEFLLWDQQCGIFGNGRKLDRATFSRVVTAFRSKALVFYKNNDISKKLVLTNSVPAVAVIQRGLALFVVNWRKGCVGA